MRTWTLSFAVALVAAGAALVASAESRDLLVNGNPWARTVVTPYDDSGVKSRIATYKVYTHLYDFDGSGFLTKGEGGLYTHHRGVFIGWMKTGIGDDIVDSWHMRGCYQEHAGWLNESDPANGALHSLNVEWRTRDGDLFIRETRTIAASSHTSGTRIFDVSSTLDAVSGPVVLEGDAQHAGMQIRLANEISEHPETTEYILPESAVIGKDDTVTSAHWACASVKIRGQRYWVMHMTPPDHPTATPVYSIRDYGRFGAFFETTIEPRAPLNLSFRIVVSREPLDQTACKRLYDAYAAARAKVDGGTGSR